MLRFTSQTKLGEKGGAEFHGLIQACIAKDKDYFKFMQNMRNLLDGKHWKNLKRQQKEELKMVVNLAHAHVRSLVPTIFFKNPTVDCMPTAPQHAGKEQTWNGILNNTLDKIGFAEEAKKIALDACFLQEAVMKDIVHKPIPEERTAGRPANDTTSVELDKSGPTVWLTKGAPVHIRVNPSQLLVDYLCKDRDLDNARFIIFRYRKPFQEVKHDSVYGKNVHRDLAKGTSITPTTGNAVTSNAKNGDEWEDEEQVDAYNPYDREELVTIYEVWVHEYISPDGSIKLKKQMFTLLEDQDEPIRELTSWDDVMVPGFSRYPATRVVLNPIPDRPPVSELETWQGLQMAVNWIMSRLVQLVENDRLLYAVDGSKIKNFNKFRQEFYSGKSRQLVEMTEPGAVELLQPSFAGRDNYTLLNLVQSGIQQVSGFGQNRRGGSGIRTAREAHIIESGVQIKTDEKVDTFEKFLLRVVEKTAMIVRGLASRDQGVSWVYRIGGDVGSISWVNFTAEDIDWIPEVRFRVNSFRKQDTMEEMQKLTALYQLSLQLRAVVGPTVRSDILFARVLEAAGVFDSGKIVGNQDAESMKQTVELAVMMGGQQTPASKDENHAAHLQIMEAFAQSNMGQQLLSSNPVFADLFQTHFSMHQQMMQEMQQEANKSALTTQNPFAAIGGDNQNAVADAAGQGMDTTPSQGQPAAAGAY